MVNLNVKEKKYVLFLHSFNDSIENFNESNISNVKTQQKPYKFLSFGHCGTLKTMM